MLHTYSNTPPTKKKKTTKSLIKKNHRWYVPTHACINKMILALLMLVQSTNSTPTMYVQYNNFLFTYAQFPNHTTLGFLDSLG